MKLLQELIFLNEMALNLDTIGSFNGLKISTCKFNNIDYPLPMVEGKDHLLAGLWSLFEDEGY